MAKKKKGKGLGIWGGKLKTGSGGWSNIQPNMPIDPIPSTPLVRTPEVLNLTAPTLPEVSTPALNLVVTPQMPPGAAPSPALTSNPFVAPPAPPAPVPASPATNKFDAVTGLISQGLETVRDIKLGNRGGIGSGDAGGDGNVSFGWSDRGLSLGGGLTLSPMVLIAAGVGLFLLFREPPGKRR
jgi:hypothetical protein